MFTKSFPKNINGVTVWEETILNTFEEKTVEKQAREDQVNLLLECLRDAKEIMDKAHFKYQQSQRLSIALSLFQKRGSHVVFKKEEKCREKFNQTQSNK